MLPRITYTLPNPMWNVGVLVQYKQTRQGVAEAQVQELVRRLRMSIWLEEKGSRSVGEVMNAVFWKRAETTPRHEAWLAFSSSTGEGIREEEEV